MLKILNKYTFDLSSSTFSFSGGNFMLQEISILSLNRYICQTIELAFANKHYHQMPRVEEVN